MAKAARSKRSKDKATEEGKAVKEYDGIIELFNKTEQYWQPIFKCVTDDYSFYAGDQWDATVSAVRAANHQSVLTYNKVAAKVKYIVNNIRNAVPQVKIRAGSDGQENTAKVLNGLIHQYERDSDADEAKINAFKSCVISGLGAWEVYLADIDDDGDIDICYDRIVDVTSVLMDPSSHKQTHEDAEFCFVKHRISKRAFNLIYKDSEMGSIGSGLDSAEGDSEDTEVVDYWFKDNNGLVSKYVINGVEILKKYEKYRGSFIPVVLLHGEEIRLKDKVEYHGIIHSIRDMQRMLNLAKSRSADEMALAPNGQYLVTPEMIAANPNQWQNPSLGNQAVLLYTAGPGGEVPRRMDPFTSSTGFYDAANAIDSDISASVGIKDTSKDLPASQSGKAIQLQMSQSDVGTYEFADNLNKAVRYSGKIVLDLIQQYLSAKLTKVITQPDGSTQSVPINQVYQENGRLVSHDLTVGSYGVDYDIAPSYMSQRQQALDSMLEYLKLNPSQMSVVSDLVFGMMDIPQSDEFAARLRATIPANVLAASSSSNLNSDNAQIKAQMLEAQLQQATGGLQQASQQIEELQQQLQQAAMESQSKMQNIEAEGKIKLFELQKKLELDKAIEESRMQHNLELETLKMQHDIEIERVKAALKIKVSDSEVSARLEADIAKIHEKAHADIFEKSMEIDQQTQQYLMTGTDLNH